MTDPVAVARESIARGSRSFALASRLLPPRVRDDAVVVYAFCRRADDAVDLAPPDEQPAALRRLRRELDALYDGHAPPDPVLRGFRAVVHARRIPKAYPAELLAGMAMDAAGTRYETLDDLLGYCYRVAGTVGLMMCHVMGLADDRALRNAAHLGIAMQLTNICRDVVEDWERGRLYLPMALLRCHGFPVGAAAPRPPFPPAARAPVARVVEALLAEADRYYRSGDAGLRALSPRCALAVRTARLVYAAIGDRIAARGHDVTRGRAVVPGIAKLALAGRAVIETAAALPRRPGARRTPARRVAFPRDVLPLEGGPP